MGHSKPRRTLSAVRIPQCMVCRTSRRAWWKGTNCSVRAGDAALPAHRLTARDAGYEAGRQQVCECGAHVGGICPIIEQHGSTSTAASCFGKGSNTNCGTRTKQHSVPARASVADLSIALWPADCHCRIRRKVRQQRQSLAFRSAGISTSAVGWRRHGVRCAVVESIARWMTS